MDDRELLEAAAKAAGIPGTFQRYWGDSGINHDSPNGGLWNPLEFDADALRLAVDLRLTVLESSVRKPDGDVVNVFPGEAPDRYAATRRAIVRAAAAMATGS